MGFDRNATVWQRLDLALKAALEDAEIEHTDEQRFHLVSDLHGYVLDERKQAATSVNRPIIF